MLLASKMKDLVNVLAKVRVHARRWWISQPVSQDMLLYQYLYRVHHIIPDKLLFFLKNIYCQKTKMKNKIVLHISFMICPLRAAMIVLILSLKSSVAPFKVKLSISVNATLITVRKYALLGCVGQNMCMLRIQRLSPFHDFPRPCRAFFRMTLPWGLSGTFPRFLRSIVFSNNVVDSWSRGCPKNPIISVAERPAFGCIPHLFASSLLVITRKWFLWMPTRVYSGIIIWRDFRSAPCRYKYFITQKVFHELVLEAKVWN